ncbi:MAG: thiamine diphosphokinase [Spirochaetota bacterium]
MRALLAIGGAAPPRSRILPLLSTIDLICAADSGLELIHEWGLTPDLIAGDMDSLRQPDLLELYKAADIHRRDRAKDDSDTEAALRLCAERGAGEIVIAGGGGGRLDHLLALRALFERRIRPCAWHLPEDSVYLVEKESRLAFFAEKGSLVSVFPLAPGSRLMKSRGLRWPLDGLVWDVGSYGLSNESLGGEVEIETGTGDLLVVRNWRFEDIQGA